MNLQVCNERMIKMNFFLVVKVWCPDWCIRNKGWRIILMTIAKDLPFTFVYLLSPQVILARVVSKLSFQMVAQFPRAQTPRETCQWRVIITRNYIQPYTHLTGAAISLTEVSTLLRSEIVLTIWLLTSTLKLKVSLFDPSFNSYIFIHI